MKTINHLKLLLAGLAALVLLTPAGALCAPSSKPEFVPGALVIKLKPGPAAAAAAVNSVAELNRRFNAKSLRPLTARGVVPAAAALAAPQGGWLSDIYLITFDPQADVRGLALAYAQSPEVAYAEPDYLRHTAAESNDPFMQSSGSWGQDYPDLWGIKRIEAPQAWETTAGEGVVVAVIDSGVDYNHPDLRDNIWANAAELHGLAGVDDDSNGYIDDIRGWNFAEDNNDPMDNLGHGTHVSGTIAGEAGNGIGVAGVAPQAKIMALKASSSETEARDSALALAVKYAADNGARVLNNSWGGPNFSKLINEAFRYAYAKNCISIVAAGNENIPADTIIPAALPTVVTVAAVDQEDGRCSFSNYGLKVDVAAPGGGSEEGSGQPNILSAISDNSELAAIFPELIVSSGYMRGMGTSMATPHVSGVAALAAAAHPKFTNREIMRLLRYAVDPISPDHYIGTGVINARKVVALKTPPPIAELKPIRRNAAGVIAIRGSAAGRHFERFTLWYGSGEVPQEWRKIHRSRQAVSRGVLSRFNSSRLEAGLYTIRLVVSARHGVFNEARTALTVAEP